MPVHRLHTPTLTAAATLPRGQDEPGRPRSPTRQRPAASSVAPGWRTTSATASIAVPDADRCPQRSPTSSRSCSSRGSSRRGDHGRAGARAGRPAQPSAHAHAADAARGGGRGAGNARLRCRRRFVRRRRRRRRWRAPRCIVAMSKPAAQPTSDTGQAEAGTSTSDGDHDDDHAVRRARSASARHPLAQTVTAAVGRPRPAGRPRARTSLAFRRSSTCS